MDERYEKMCIRDSSMADLKGDSYLIQKLKNDIYKLVESSSTVLITGETGTGKEIVAHAIHSIGGRQLYPRCV